MPTIGTAQAGNLARGLLIAYAVISVLMLALPFFVRDPWTQFWYFVFTTLGVNIQ
jgi:hypothetical protein